MWPDISLWMINGLSYKNQGQKQQQHFRNVKGAWKSYVH